MSAYNFALIQHVYFFDFPELAFASLIPVIGGSNVTHVELQYGENVCSSGFVQEFEFRGLVDLR